MVKKTLQHFTTVSPIRATPVPWNLAQSKGSCRLDLSSVGSDASMYMLCNFLNCRDCGTLTYVSSLVAGNLFCWNICTVFLYHAVLLMFYLVCDMTCSVCYTLPWL